MSLPKEPRQRMINFMYLVLTAMLALNVSGEILNAFKVVNESILMSNKIIGDRNQVTYKSFEDRIKDTLTMQRAVIWQPKAEQVKKYSAEMYAYIDSLKAQLNDFYYDNLDAPTRLMEKQGRGMELYNKLQSYRTNVSSVLDATGYKQTIPINLAVPASLDTRKKYTDDAKGWTASHFYMTPTIAATAILSKLQNDVKNAEAQMIDYCYQQIGAVKLVYDNFQAFAQANSSYVMPGDDLVITAGVGAFSSAAKPEIYIDGTRIPVGDDGKAIWKTTATGEGRKQINAEIIYVKPDGTKERKVEVIPYEVARPAGVAVSPNKMNVLYLAVENPLTITAGTGSEKITASFSAGDIRKTGGNQWIVVPTKQGDQFVNVSVDGKISPVKFRVKKLPDPFAYVSGKRGGAIKTNDFKAGGGVTAKLDSDFEAVYQVLSYRVGLLDPTGFYEAAFNQGSVWSGNAKKMIDKARPGSIIFFDEVKVKGPGGIEADLPQMSFNLK